MDLDVSSTMRPFLREVWHDRQPLVHRVGRLVIDRFHSYAATPSAEVWVGMTRILERIVEGDPFAPPTPADQEAAYGTGVQGGGAGIDIADLVGAVLLGAREVELEVMQRAEAAGVPADLRLEAATRTRAWAEQVALWAAEGLRDAGPAESASRRAARLLADLLEGYDGRGHAAALGLDVAVQWWAVAAVGLGQPATAAVAAAAMRYRSAGQPTAWSAEGRVTRGLVPVRPAPVADLVVGVAGPAEWDDLGDALADAERARRAAVRFVGSGVHSLNDLGLLVTLHEDAALASRLQTRWVQPLLAEPRHDLARTLAVYLERGGHVDQVAHELIVHPNTVRNRVARADRLLGRSWRGARGQAELWAALTVYRAPSPAL